MTPVSSFTFFLLSLFFFFCSIVFLLRIQGPVILHANFIFSFNSTNKDADGCGSVYASADISEDEVFLFIPFERMVITDALARSHLLLSTASAQSLDSRTAINLFLIQQQAGATAVNQSSDNQEEKRSNDSLTSATGSFYKPYLDMLPDKIHTALEFDEQDMEHLRGTNAYMVVKELKEALRAKYDKTMEAVGGELTVEQGYTWERFLWAETVVSSRTFPASLFGHQVENGIVLIPLAGKLFSIAQLLL